MLLKRLFCFTHYIATSIRNSQERMIRIIVLLLLCFPLWSQAQQPSYSGYGGSGAALNPMMPDDFRVQLDLEESIAVQFYQMTYSGSRLDLRRIKALHKDIPAYVDIVPPNNLDFYKDITVLVGVPEKGLVNDNTVVIWLAANFSTNSITLFSDDDQDRNFLNDPGLHEFQAGPSPRKILLKSKPEGGRDRVYYLSLPKRKKPSFDRNKRQRKIINKLSIGMSLSTGSGGLEYSYENLDTGSPAWYNVDFTERIFRLDLSYNLSFISAGVDFSYQGVNYYASYLTELLANPGNGPDRVTTANQDLHGATKTQYGLSVVGRIPISRSTEIQPVVRYGMVSFKNQEYFPNRYQQESINLPAVAYLETGIRVEFVAGMFSAIYVEATKFSQDWKPEGLLDGINNRDFSSELKSTRFGVGYRKAIRF